MVVTSSKTVLISAPGKIILHGEHAVVHGRRALACGLNLKTFSLVRVMDDGWTRLHLPDININKQWKTSELLQFTSQEENTGTITPLTQSRYEAICKLCEVDPNTHETRELAAVSFVALYSSILPQDKMIDMDLVVSSNLPPSAGLGSSAAFSVTLAASLLMFSGKISIPKTDSSCTWPHDDLELINSWAFMAEKIIHGNPSGIDNSISTFGGVVKFQNKQLEHLQCNQELSVVITNTKVPRSTKKLVANVAQKLKEFPQIIKPVMDAIEGISVRCQEEITSNRAMDEDIIRVLISDNQSLLSVLGVGHPAIENVCRITDGYGLVSKLTGAGGGGCTITLVPHNIADDVVNKMINELQTSGYDCWRASIGGPGVSMHSEECINIPNLPETIRNQLPA